MATILVYFKNYFSYSTRYYNSYGSLSESSNPGAIMTDTFYSQVGYCGQLWV